MFKRSAVLVAILVLPVAALAQRGGGDAPPIKGVSKVPKDVRPNYNGPGAVGGSVTISNKDIERLNPIKALVDHRKDLAVTDEQLKQLKDLDARVKAENDSLFHQLDSLRKEMKPSTAAPAVESIRVRGLRTSLVEVITAIRENYDRAEPDALGVLAEPQQKAASELLETQQQDAEKMLQEKLGGRPGRPGGPGGASGGRPGTPPR
jgi:hypothetical protein